MAIEIERKFLVRNDTWKSSAGVYMSQGYLTRDKHRTVRVRIAGDSAKLTIKGFSSGIARPEFEYDIPLEDAKQLQELCEKPLIEKIRHTIDCQGFIWEVDEFLGENKGLVVAEIELSAEDQEFARPEWLGAEVTGDAKYYNANLGARPFTTWNK